MREIEEKIPHHKGGKEIFLHPPTLHQKNRGQEKAKRSTNCGAIKNAGREKVAGPALEGKRKGPRQRETC